MQCADEIQTEVVVQPDIDVKMEDVFNNINDIQLDSTTPLSELEKMKALLPEIKVEPNG